MREMRNSYDILVGKPEEKDHLQDLAVGEKIILEWILGKLAGRVWTGCSWFRVGTRCRSL